MPENINSLIYGVRRYYERGGRFKARIKEMFGKEMQREMDEINFMNVAGKRRVKIKFYT